MTTEYWAAFEIPGILSLDTQTTSFLPPIASFWCIFYGDSSHLAMIDCESIGVRPRLSGERDLPRGWVSGWVRGKKKRLSS